MSSPDKLSLIIQSGEFDRVYYALVMASAALATGKQVTLLFTMDGTRALMPGWSDTDRAAALSAAGLADFEELLTACRELGALFMICETGLRAAGLTPEQLRDDIEISEGSAVSFVADASATGAMLYI